MISPLIFNLYINKINDHIIYGEINRNHLPSLEGENVGFLAFADDIILVSYVKDTLQQMADNAVLYLASLDLNINLQYKCK